MPKPDTSGEATALEYLTVGQVAEALKVKPRTVYRWVEADEIPHIRFGGTVRIPKSALTERQTEEAS